MTIRVGKQSHSQLAATQSNRESANVHLAKFGKLCEVLHAANWDVRE